MMVSKLKWVNYEKYNWGGYKDKWVNSKSVTVKADRIIQLSIILELTCLGLGAFTYSIT